MIIGLPFPPTTNRIWRNIIVNGKPRTLLSKEGRSYREQVGKICLREKVAGKMLTGRLSVVIEVSPPDKRPRDLDNMIKASFDALTHAGVWADDSQIDRIWIERMPPEKGGNFAIEIREL